VLRLFVDGVLVASNSASGDLVLSDESLCMGGNSLWGGLFAGKLDGVRIYNRALAATEIQADMNRAAGSPPAITLHPRAQTAEEMISHGGYRFDLSADSAVAVAIEATTDFVTWQSIAALQYTNGLVEIVDPVEVLPALGFYRVRATSGSPAITLGVQAQSTEQLLVTGFKLTITADAPAPLMVERTSDFVVWKPVGEVTYTNGVVEVIDPAVKLPPFRFYRARLQ